MGSASGTAVVSLEENTSDADAPKRNHCSDRFESRPGARHAFWVPHGTAVALRVGSQLVCLNPKLCVVCLDRPRALLLKCGHRVLCEKCCAQTALERRGGNIVTD